MTIISMHWKTDLILKCYGGNNWFDFNACVKKVIELGEIWPTRRCFFEDVENGMNMSS